MTNSIMMAGLIGIPSILVVLVALILLAAVAVGVAFAIWFIIKIFRKPAPTSTPASIATPAPAPTQAAPLQPQPEPRPAPQSSAPLPAQTLAVPKCPQCHVPLPPNTPEGLCPQCLAKAAFPSEPAAEPNRTPPSVADLAAQFPQLEIIELLGMGGMGMVYKARQLKLDRLVALKILPVQSNRDPSFAERFSREARALAKLNHPGIVTIYDFGQTDSYYYFVMEFVDGMNLRQVLRAQKLSPEEALQLVTQICSALQFAHEEGIVHRDIKPENILLNKKGVAKIADFGLAKLLGAVPDTNLTASQMVMGTFNYMAPEQREKPLTVDHRADIYSLGVVFYEMLTGELPIGRFAPPSQKVHVDVRLDEVVLKSLEKEPDRRYQHASDVKTDVESVTGTAPPKMFAPQPLSPPAQTDPHDLFMEIGPVVGVLALVGFGMAVIEAAWPVVFLFISSFTGYRSRSLRARGWARTIWTIGVLLLTAYGVWLAKSVWPVIGLLVLFDWGAGTKSKKDDEKNSPGKPPVPNMPNAPAASRPPVMPFTPAAGPKPTQFVVPVESKPSFWKSRGPIFVFAGILFLVFVLGPGKSWHAQDILLKIVLPIAFLIGLRSIITQQQGGLKFSDLPQSWRRRLALEVAGLSAAVAVACFALFMVFPMRVTESKEYSFIPNSAAFKKVTFAGDFTHYSQPLGNKYDAAPSVWPMTLNVFTNDDSAVTMTVTLPGLRAEYDLPNFQGGPVTHVLDREMLTEWLRDTAMLDVTNAAMQTASQQIMQLLKSFENYAPHTADEFDTRAQLVLKDFYPGGFNMTARYDASFAAFVGFMVVLLVGYFGGSAWVVRRTFDHYRKTVATA